MTDEEVDSVRELFDAEGKIKPVSFISRLLGLGEGGGRGKA